MRFEVRDIKLYPEPVKVSLLVEEEIYFSVSYVDRKKLIPILEPCVFAGRNLAPGDSGQLYFQCLDPVRREAPRESSSRVGYEQFHIESEEGARLFEYEQALEELMLCLLRRQGRLGHLSESAIAAGHSLRFDTRELQPLSEPVHRTELNEGSIYFSVFFVDDDFHIPGLEPYVFVGRDVETEEPGLYFQDIKSYRRGVRYGTATEGTPAVFVVDSDDNLNHFEYEQALEQLMLCSLRRRPFEKRSLS